MGLLMLLLSGCPPQPPPVDEPPPRVDADAPSNPAPQSPNESLSQPTATSTADSSSPQTPANDPAAKPQRPNLSQPNLPQHSGVGQTAGTGSSTSSASQTRAITAMTTDWATAQQQATAALRRSETSEASGDSQAALLHALDARAAVARSDWGDPDATPGSPADAKRKELNADAGRLKKRIDQRLERLDAAGAGQTSPAGTRVEITIQ